MKPLRALSLLAGVASVSLFLVFALPALNIAQKLEPPSGITLTKTYPEVIATSPKVDVRAFGASGDGSADDGRAIREAVSYCAKLKNPVLYFPPGPGYAVTATVRIPPGMDVEMDAPLIFKGGSEAPALVIGSPGSATFGKRLKVGVTRKNLSDWKDEDCVGVRIINANSCDITVMQAARFTIGAQFMGDAGGFAYNDVKLLYINSNRIGVDLTNDNDGWTNENTFSGGRFCIDSTANTSSARYGVRITSKEKYYNNNNYFIRPSFELEKKATSGEAVPVLAEYAQYNEFRSCRDEGNGPVFARVCNQSQANVFDIGYGGMNARVEEKGTFPSSMLGNRWNYLRNSGTLVFSSGPIYKRACRYDPSRVNVAGVHVASSGSGGIFKAGNLAILPDYLEIPGSSGVGILVNTSAAKRFVVRQDSEPSGPGRVAVRCYDGSGNVLGNGGYVKGMSNLVFRYSYGFGGVYVCGETRDNAYFTVGPEVKSVAVIITGGPSPCRLREFSVFTPDPLDAVAWTGYEEAVPGANVAAAPPSSGKWDRGKVVYNCNPAPGGYAGWVCVSGGAPGVWKGFGLIAR